MADTLETKPTETVKEPVIETPPVEKPLTLEELQTKLAIAEQHAKNKEEEAARHFKKIQSFEQAEQAKKDAELSELDKEKKARAKLEEENKKLKVDSLKTSIAAKLGLPNR